MIPEYIEFMRLADKVNKAKNKLNVYLKKIHNELKPYFYCQTNTESGDWEVIPNTHNGLMERLGYSFRFNRISNISSSLQYFITREDGETRELSIDMYAQTIRFIENLYFDAEGNLNDKKKRILPLVSYADKQRIKDILVEEYNKCFPKTQEQLK